LLPLQTGLSPGDREQREGDDQYERGSPREQPGRHGEVLPAYQSMSRGEVREEKGPEEGRQSNRSGGASPSPRWAERRIHGLTWSSAIGSSVWFSLWSSISNTPSSFAGNEKVTGLCSAGFSIS
jgi:hypothetical protein